MLWGSSSEPRGEAAWRKGCETNPGARQEREETLRTPAPGATGLKMYEEPQRRTAGLSQAAPRPVTIPSHILKVWGGL